MKSDDIAFSLLKKLGFQVEKIPTSDKENKKEADFLVKYEDCTAIIEAKLKEDSQEVLEEREKDLSEGKASIVRSSLGRNETYSGIIRGASKQLKSSSDKPHDFKIILFIVTGINPKSKKDQIKDTIYGSTIIVDGNSSKICYFFRYNDFSRRENIDAVIIGESNICNSSISFELCLNSYSKNYGKLKKSKFIKPFYGAVIDPIELEKKGMAYIVDEKVNRKLDELQQETPMYNPILQHLRKKYKKGYLYNVDFDAPDFAIRSNV